MWSRLMLKFLSLLPVDVVANIALDIILEVFSWISKDSGLFAAKLSFQRLQAVLNYGRILYPKFISNNPMIDPITFP